MYRIKKETFGKFLSVICLFCFLSGSMFPYFVGNYSEHAFKRDNNITSLVPTGFIICPKSTLPYNQTVKELASMSGAYFLASESRYLELLHILETQHSNMVITPIRQENSYSGSCVSKNARPGIICESLSCLITTLYSSINTYEELINYSSSLEKEERVIQILRCFRYNEFLDSIPGSVGLDHSMISELLSSGDVVGVYRKLKTDCTTLRVKLSGIQSLFNCPTISDIEFFINNEDSVVPRFWEISRDFANIHLFGEHVSRIFFYIRNNIDQTITPYWDLTTC